MPKDKLNEPTKEELMQKKEALAELLKKATDTAEALMNKKEKATVVPPKEVETSPKEEKIVASKETLVPANNEEFVPATKEIIEELPIKKEETAPVKIDEPVVKAEPVAVIKKEEKKKKPEQIKKSKESKQKKNTHEEKELARIIAELENEDKKLELENEAILAEIKELERQIAEFGEEVESFDEVEEVEQLEEPAGIIGSSRDQMSEEEFADFSSHADLKPEGKPEDPEEKVESDQIKDKDAEIEKLRENTGITGRAFGNSVLQHLGIIEKADDKRWMADISPKKFKETAIYKENEQKIKELLQQYNIDNIDNVEVITLIPTIYKGRVGLQTQVRHNGDNIVLTNLDVKPNSNIQDLGLKSEQASEEYQKAHEQSLQQEGKTQGSKIVQKAAETVVENKEGKDAGSEQVLTSKEIIDSIEEGRLEEMKKELPSKERIQDASFGGKDIAIGDIVYYTARPKFRNEILEKYGSGSYTEGSPEEKAYKIKSGIAFALGQDYAWGDIANNTIDTDSIIKTIQYKVKDATEKEITDSLNKIITESKERATEIEKKHKEQLDLFEKKYNEISEKIYSKYDNKYFLAVTQGKLRATEAKIAVETHGSKNSPAYRELELMSVVDSAQDSDTKAEEVVVENKNNAVESVEGEREALTKDILEAYDKHLGITVDLEKNPLLTNRIADTMDYKDRAMLEAGYPVENIVSYNVNEILEAVKTFKENPDLKIIRAKKAKRLLETMQEVASKLNTTPMVIASKEKTLEIIEGSKEAIEEFLAKHEYDRKRTLEGEYQAILSRKNNEIYLKQRTYGGGARIFRKGELGEYSFSNPKDELAVYLAIDNVYNNEKWTPEKYAETYEYLDNIISGKEMAY